MGKIKNNPKATYNKYVLSASIKINKKKADCYKRRKSEII